ncbi:hypothetical protein RMATCC62417_15694 [Rhizopus microsporus]|nr:hypothetical protein RMATCC62417_15694 [Rhizopus microsporus]
MVIASAPGKVLITGGYLVLEPEYTGTVIGTSSRFYTVIQPGANGLITVRSPQFDNANWTYEITMGTTFTLKAQEVGSPNKFVETALAFTLKIILKKQGMEKVHDKLMAGMDIIIVGDNDFYSQRVQLKSKNLPNTVEALASLTPFCKTYATLATVHKTGLGSSAALITSLVAALLLRFEMIEDVTSDKNKKWVHNVAQFVHCFAQGKVGSGFDVSSAVWGSHCYKRFNPDTLKPVMDNQVDSQLLLNTLDPANQNWDNQVVPLKLPPGFDLLLADIDAGSHTPTLVSKALAWKKSNPEQANALWKELGGYNQKVEQHLRKLSDLYEQDPARYQSTIDICSSLHSNEWRVLEGDVVYELVGLVDDYHHVRSLLRKMGDASDVPIEPKEQTRLLDTCMQVPGVVMAGVPGAGGYDAIFCIVLSDAAKQEVRKVWQSWKELNVGPLLSQADSNGITCPKLNEVPGLFNVISQ